MNFAVFRSQLKNLHSVKTAHQYNVNTTLSTTTLTTTRDYFGDWQVEPYARPVATSDEIPKNVYGNVYLFQRWMVPKGCAHVVYPNLRKILTNLKLPFAPAMVFICFLNI